MTRRQKLRLVNKFTASCEKPLSTPRLNETPSQERHRLLTDVVKRFEMFIDAGMYERGQRGTWIRHYWEAENNMYAAADEVRRRCIEEGRQ